MDGMWEGTVTKVQGDFELWGGKLNVRISLLRRNCSRSQVEGGPAEYFG